MIFRFSTIFQNLIPHASLLNSGNGSRAEKYLVVEVRCFAGQSDNSRASLLPAHLKKCECSDLREHVEMKRYNTCALLPEVRPKNVSVPASFSRRNVSGTRRRHTSARISISDLHLGSGLCICKPRRHSRRRRRRRTSTAPTGTTITSSTHFCVAIRSTERYESCQASLFFKIQIAIFWKNK